MTDSELHDAIFADATAKAMADAGNDAGAAARMAAILPPTLASTYVNERGVFAAFADPADAEAVMAGLEAVAGTSATMKRVLNWMQPNNGGVDLSYPSVRAMLDQLQAAGALTPVAVATLKALAERPAIVSANDVSRAMAPDRTEGRLA